MTRISLTELAHSLLAKHLQIGDIAIDATLGNGHDALFLARCIGEKGKVYGFDIQQQAVEASYQRLLAHDLLPCVELILASHNDMERFIPVAQHGKAKAIMFNLGYLPGGDKSLITGAETTLPALDAASRLLAVQGMLSVLAYPGHAGGDQEAERIRGWCDDLDRQVFEYEIIDSDASNPQSPRLFVICKQG